MPSGTNDDADGSDAGHAAVAEKPTGPNAEG